MDGLKIMLVTPRLAEECQDGLDYHVWGLARALASRGHRVEIFTTCSSLQTPTRRGYLLWNNYFPSGRVEREGLSVHRFPVRNAFPAMAGWSFSRMQKCLEREEEQPLFARTLSACLDPGRCCLVSGWYGLEEWDDGPARWCGDHGSIAVRADHLESLRLRLFSALDQEVEVAENGGKKYTISLRAGEEGEMVFKFPARDRLSLVIRPRRVHQPEVDRRQLGVALRSLTYGTESGEVSADLSCDLKDLLDHGSEDTVFNLLWSNALVRRESYSRHQARVVGPRSGALRKALEAEAGRFDAIVAFMLPMPTLAMATRAAEKAGVPCIPIALLHLRDRYHYWPGFIRVLEHSRSVDASSPTLRRLLASVGVPAFAAGPGLDAAEFAGEADVASFRNKYHLGEGPILLWVGRKNPRKGYATAMAAAEIVREHGIPVELVMVGPDEDGVPVGGTNALYLGPLSREELLQAYACCDVFILPSLDESFGLSYCEAWLAGKPVLGARACCAIRDLIDHGEDGFLCEGSEEYALAVEKLLSDRELAVRMGRKGKDKVIENFLWERIAEQFEGEIVKTLE